MGNLVLLDGNKISGGINYITPECYSTEEREIGCWIDGKPLYQKTYVKNNVGSNNVTVDADMTLSNVTLVGFINNGIEMNSLYSGEVFKEYVSSAVVLRVFNSASGLQCNLEGNHNYTGNVRFTVQYTKVSDTAGSGTWTPSGILTVHYSTDEQVIGTYFGETLYEKSWTNLNVTMVISGGDWQEISDVDLTGVAVIVDSKVWRQGGTSLVKNNNIAETGISSNQKLQLAYLNSIFGGTIKTITLQYTKSS